MSPKIIAAKTGDVHNVQSPAPQGTSLLAKGAKRFLHNKMAMASLLVTSLLFLTSLLADFVAPYQYADGVIEAQNQPPSWYRIAMSETFVSKVKDWAAQEEDFDLFAPELPAADLLRPEAANFFESSLLAAEPEAILLYFEAGVWSHLMGTDEIGQDIFSRVIYGLRLSIMLSLTVTLISVLIGILYGAVAAYSGGLVDALMMRFVDFLFGVPFIFLVILLMVFFGREIYLIFVGLGLVYWIVLARIVRGQVLSLKNKEFVLAAITNGVPARKIIIRHLVPNAVGPVIVFATLLVPQIMLLEAFLSFIGLGVSPPEVSLGILISDGAAVISTYSWPIIFPGIVFSIMIFCMNFIGDGLRDALDPKIAK